MKLTRIGAYRLFHTIPTILAVFLLPLSSFDVLAQSLDRPVDEVIIRGSDLPGLTAGLTPLDRIHIYRWNGSAFEPIPFQINEVRTWQLVDNLLTDCALPPDFDPERDRVCETNYAFDFATGQPGGDNPAGFDANDEIVFMARDAGLEAPDCVWVGENVAPTRYRVQIADEQIQGDQIITVGTGWVYIFKWNEPHAPEYNRHYVEWQAMGSAVDPDRNEACRGGDPVVSRRLLACGWARGNASSTTGQSSEPTLDLRWIGNWTINRLRVRGAGNTGTPYADVVDRFKARIGNCPDLCETEEDWDLLGCARYLGLKAYDPSTGANPIHEIRLSQGAMSGATTTRADRYFGTHLRSRIRLRVHFGVGPLRVHPDLLTSATPMNLWTATYPPGAQPPVPADVINGAGVDHNPPGSYVGGAGAFNWNQFDSPANGKFLVVTRETRPFRFSLSPTYYYSDVATEDDPQEHEEAQIGNAGVRWQGQTLDMQDRNCDDFNPDNPDYLWREAEISIYALPPDRNASTVIAWLQRPLQTYPFEQTLLECPVPPPPGPPCKPSLTPVNPGTGFSLTLGPTTDCPDTTAGYAIYRADGAGTYFFQTSMKRGQSWIDPAVRHGTTYHYRAFPFTSVGTHGPGSDEATVTVLDTTNPAPPTGLSEVPLSHGARIDWGRSTSFDVIAYDVYASFFSGGPYQKVNAQPISIPTQTLTVTTFDPTKMYYIVLKSIDSVGNQSAFSDEIVVTPLP